MANEAKPWERQDGETSTQFEAFVIYRDMGADRSLTKVAEKLQKSTTLMGRWSGKNNWVERAASWDDEQDRVARQEQINDIRKMRKRHADLAKNMLDKAERALLNMPEEEIKASDISRMVDVASKLERLSRGDTSEVIEERHGEAVSAVQIYIPDNNRGRDKDSFDDLEV